MSCHLGLLWRAYNTSSWLTFKRILCSRSRRPDSTKSSFQAPNRQQTPAAWDGVSVERPVGRRGESYWQVRFRSQRTSKRREKAIALQNNNNIKLQRNRKCQSTVKLKGVESHDFCILPDWLTKCLCSLDWQCRVAAIRMKTWLTLNATKIEELLENLKWARYKILSANVFNDPGLETLTYTPCVKSMKCTSTIAA